MNENKRKSNANCENEPIIKRTKDSNKQDDSSTNCDTEQLNNDDLLMRDPNIYKRIAETQFSYIYLDPINRK